MKITGCSKIALALALLGVLTASSASAQMVRSYCLTGVNAELGHCDYPTFEACRGASAGYGTCIASEQPVSGWPAATATVPAATRRQR